MLVEPRGKELRYSLEHNGDYFYIITNKDGSLNSKLMRTRGVWLSEWGTSKHGWMAASLAHPGRDVPDAHTRGI